jgi:hypothetical protein
MSGEHKSAPTLSLSGQALGLTPIVEMDENPNDGDPTTVVTDENTIQIEENLANDDLPAIMRSLVKTQQQMVKQQQQLQTLMRQTLNVLMDNKQNEQPPTTATATQSTAPSSLNTATIPPAPPYLLNRHKKILPTFNGDSTDIALYHSFKVKFKLYLDYYNVPREQTHSVLSDALIGDASYWFIGYTEEYPEILNLNVDQLMLVLDEEYLNPLAQVKYQYDYEQLKADHNESVEELSRRIQKAAIKAGIKKRTNQAKKHKLFSLLPSWLQSSQVNTLNNDTISYEEFKTNLIHMKELSALELQKKKLNYHEVSNVNNVTMEKPSTKAKGFNSCDYCGKANHSAEKCSALLTDLHFDRGNASEFWEEHGMEEKLSG